MERFALERYIEEGLNAVKRIMERDSLTLFQKSEVLHSITHQMGVLAQDNALQNALNGQVDEVMQKKLERKIIDDVNLMISICQCSNNEDIFTPQIGCNHVFDNPDDPEIVDQIRAKFVQKNNPKTRHFRFGPLNIMEAFGIDPNAFGQEDEEQH